MAPKPRKRQPNSLRVRETHTEAARRLLRLGLVLPCRGAENKELEKQALGEAKERGARGLCRGPVPGTPL